MQNTRNGPTIGPTLVYAIKNAARTATSEVGGKHSLQSLMMAPLKISHPRSTRDRVLAKDCWSRGYLLKLLVGQSFRMGRALRLYRDNVGSFSAIPTVGLGSRPVKADGDALGEARA